MSSPIAGIGAERSPVDPVLGLRAATARPGSVHAFVGSSRVSTLPFGFSELLLAGRMRQSGCEETWTFEISLPVLPPKRSFLIAAGLEHAVGMLERFAEEGPDLAGLDPKRLPAPLDADLLEQIESLRFTGSVEAVPEGTVVFAGEPVLRLRAPAPEAVLVGAALVGALRSQTAVATKAARLVLAAGGKPVYEIGVRSGVRETALHAARSAHVGGASATANAGAAIEFGLPSLPVVPLTLVAALGGEVAGLEACGVLIDGALANEGDAALTALSGTPRAIIIDAGTRNLAARVTAMRSGIQSLGWRTTRILVGGRVDEEIIDALQKTGVDVDGFCVGGELIVAADSPCVAFDYELVEREVDGHKIPLPRRDGGVGRRSVWRRREAGKFKSDTVQAESKPPPPGGMPLLVRVVDKGRRLFRAPSLAEVRVLCGSQLSMIDPNVTRRIDPDTYTVTCVVDKKPEEAAPAGKAKKAAPPPEATPKSGPLGPADARRRALSQIDDSADFSAISGAFDSVVSPHLGDDEAAGSSEDEASADDTTLPAEDAPQEPDAEPAATEEGSEPAAEPDDSFEAIHLDDPPAAEPDGEESIEGTTEETAVEATEADANSEMAPDGDEVPAEPLATEEAPADEGAAAPVEDFASMVQQLAPKRGDFEPAAAAVPDGADEAPADGIIEIVPPAAPVAPPRSAPAQRAASPTKAAPRPVPPPEPTEDLEVLPTFGNPTPPRRMVAHEGGASTSNPLLAAAARLRSMQRGEPLQPQTPAAPIESVSAPKPAAAAKKAPATDSPSDPLLAAAARLKSMRGS